MFDKGFIYLASDCIPPGFCSNILGTFNNVLIPLLNVFPVLFKPSFNGSIIFLSNCCATAFCAS